MNRLRWYLLVNLLVLSSCATYNTQLTPDEKSWQQETPPSSPLIHQVYTVGNLGQTSPGSAIWRTLQDSLAKAEGKTSLILTGNQLADGMPDSQDPQRSIRNLQLDRITNMVEDFNGQLFFLAGNLDWKTYGLEGLIRQQKYLEEALDNKNLFFPNPGCGDPQEIELDDGLVLILLDSQWWLEDWNGQAKINADCDVKDRSSLAPYFEDLVKGNRSNHLIIASHHPPYSNGYYGGQYPLEKHIFPLTFLQKGLYLPLPILGTLVSTVRASIGSPQDLSHPGYRALKNLMVSSARKNGSFVFVSSHENNQQLLERDDQTYLISGAGKPKHAARTGNGAVFSAGDAGYNRLDYYENGAAWANFFNSEGKLLFRKMIMDAKQTSTLDEMKSNETLLSQAKIQTPLSQTDFSRNKTGTFLWGEHYRKVYNASLEVPTLNLNDYERGVIPIKRGGGYQTNSLRLEGSDERQYAMRALEKDATRTIPYPYNQSIILDIIKDNFSASHPLGALPVPQLAKAAGVYSANPKLYYVPHQKALGLYNDQFGDALYLIEERPDDKLWKESTNFGQPDDIMSTHQAIDKVLKEHDHLIDYQHVVRSRLFDVMIGDWDRHDDQWRWAVTKEDKLKIYRPIPRDRDQAFSEYDGFIMSFVRQSSALAKRWIPFDEKIKKVKWTGYGARYFDATFLAGAERSVWENMAEEIIQGVDDKTIEMAFQEAWPAQIYDLNGPNIVEKLKQRRNDLMEYARELYAFHARKVDVIGTEEEDYFLIDRKEDGSVEVSVWGMKKNGDRKEKYYQRKFLPSETKEVILYGLGKNDHFKFQGRATGGILVRVLGGLGEDRFEDDVKQGTARRNLIYDAKSEELDFQSGKSTRLKLSSDPAFNTYNRKSLDYEYNFSGILPTIGFNPDDGISLGASANIRTFGFRKAPYAAHHLLSARFALETKGSVFNYRGDFMDVAGHWDFLLEAHFQTPFYTGNFYGFGNDSPNPEEVLGDDYNRVRQQVIEVFPAFMRKKNENYFAIGPLFQSIKTQKDEGRLISILEEELDPETFNGLEYLGGKAVYHYKNADQLSFPTYGIQLDAETAYLQQLNNTDNSYHYIKGAFSLYRHLDPDKTLVLATRIGAHYTFNNEFTFFQGAVLGGPGPNSNFRGVRRDRYRGKAAFYQNIDLRWKLLSSENRTIPFSFGLLLGADYGRVWLEGEDSDTWHHSLGAGFFISPFDQMSIIVSAFRADNDQLRLVIGGGFFF